MQDEVFDFDRAALRNILFKRNMQQKELAEKLGITPATLSKYMVGKVTPNLSMIYKISHVLDVPFETFSNYPIYAGSGLESDNDNVDNQLSTPENNLLPKEPTRALWIMQTVAAVKTGKQAFQTFAGVIMQNVLDSCLPPETKKAVVEIIETTFQTFIEASESPDYSNQKNQE